jgi:hypothetical protein
MSRSCIARDGSIDYACGTPSRGGRVRKRAPEAEQAVTACAGAARRLVERLRALQETQSSQRNDALDASIEALQALIPMYEQCDLERIVQEHAFLRQELLPGLNLAIDLVEQRLEQKRRSSVPGRAVIPRPLGSPEQRARRDRSANRRLLLEERASLSRLNGSSQRIQGTS